MSRAFSIRFRKGSYQKRLRRGAMRVSVLAMLLLLVSSIVALPFDRAWAGQTLVVPSHGARAAASAPTPPSTSGSSFTPYTDNRPVPGMGTISDYMHQPGDSASARAYPSQPAAGYAYTSNDPRDNSSQLLTAALVGGAIIGLIALSNYSAHHHRHR